MDKYENNLTTMCSVGIQMKCEQFSVLCHCLASFSVLKFQPITDDLGYVNACVLTTNLALESVQR